MIDPFSPGVKPPAAVSPYCPTNQWILRHFRRSGRRACGDPGRGPCVHREKQGAAGVGTVFLSKGSQNGLFLLYLFAFSQKKVKIKIQAQAFAVSAATKQRDDVMKSPFLGYREFSSIEDLKNWSRPYGPALRMENFSFPADDPIRNAVILYTGRCHDSIRHFLRMAASNQVFCRTDTEKDVIDNILLGMAQFRLSENVVCRRYVSKAHLAMLLRHAPQRRFPLRPFLLERGFTCASLLPEQYRFHSADPAEGSDLVRLTILVDKSCRVLFLPPATGRWYQAELLIAPRTTFAVLKKSKTDWLCKVQSQEEIQVEVDNSLQPFWTYGAGTY